MILQFLPFITCLFWLVLNLLVHKKDKAFKALELMVSIIAVTSLAQTCIHLFTPNTATLIQLLAQLGALFVIPISLIYLDTLMPNYKAGLHPMVWITVPASLIFVQIILLIVYGADNFMEYTNPYSLNVTGQEAIIICICSFWAFWTILVIETAIWVYMAVIKTRTGFRHIQIYYCTATIILCFLMLISFSLSGATSWITLIICLLLSCSIFMLSYAGLFHDRSSLDVKELINMNDSPLQKEDERRRMAPVIGTEEEMLKTRFENLILSQQLYLKQGIRVSDITTQLGTNRTYISRLVNTTYDMSFSDYINSLRIEYAKEYLLTHSHLKQAQIATDCGFPNASAFNNIFKRLTGVTPKIWIVTNSQANRKQQ